MATERLSLLWLKRDLRLRDHAPLAAAAESGAFLAFYCFEPSIMVSPKHSPRHWRFVAESLADLQRRGLPVAVFWGEVEEALAILRARTDITTLYSHQETSHKLTFDRDLRVKRWCQSHGIAQREFVQDAVIRGRKHRIGFAERVDEFLASPPFPVPAYCEKNGERRICGAVDPDTLPLPQAVPATGFTEDFTLSQTEVAVRPKQPGLYRPAPGPPDLNFQPGGETVAWRYLRSFTGARGRGYARQIGNPSLSRRSCSRMSTYLAWGCVSAREVFQWAKSAAVAPAVRHDLKMFRERLWWRAHYYQKLEAEWQIERRPINIAFKNLHRTCDPARLERFRTGTTGFPMIDAAVRCLETTGWINFRMRAMLVTFATFVLWLDWRPVATFLGSRFLDYDPGIHYGQFQMQAGLTGYHPPRNYNPYKQGEQQDPDGTFVHRWVPELRHIPAPWCHYPHRLTVMEQTMYGFSADQYPAPLVDYATASAENMERYFAVRRSEEAQELLPAIWALHCLPESMEKYLEGEVPSPRRDV